MESVAWWRWGYAIGVLALLGGSHGLAQEKAFVSAGTSFLLEERTTNAAILLQSMRLNRAANEWNFELVVSNRSGQTLAGPLVLEVEALSGTSGLLRPDGLTQDQPPRGYVDLSLELPLSGVLGPGEVLSRRTLALGVGSGTPRIAARLYGRVPVSVPLATMRTLNEFGQPLPGATVEVSGPGGLATNQTDAVLGVASAGRGFGLNTFKFSAPGHLPVWRQQALRADGIAQVPNPRLVRPSASSQSVSALFGGTLTNRDSNIRVRFEPGAVGEDTTATLTSLDGQTLPAFLPLGWSSVQAFWLETGATPTQPAEARLAPWVPVRTNETAVLVQWDATALQWQVLAVTNGFGSASLPFSLPGGGAYAVVVADTGDLAPPPAVPGSSLSGVSAPAMDWLALSAEGVVQPPTSPASVVPELVTAMATVTISNRLGALPSGVLLRADVQETYRMVDGTRRVPPPFETFVTVYQRPGDANAATLHATFPLRPVLLLGPDTLEEARVRVEIRPPTAGQGAILDAAGGLVTEGAARLVVGAGDLASPQVVQLRELAPTNFVGLLTEGTEVVAAVDLGLPGLQAGRRVDLQLSGMASNAYFVLSRVVSGSGLYGLEPRERLLTDATGRLASLEPAAGVRLPGITNSGQFVLVRVAGPQGLLSGVARNSSGQPAGGLPVRVQGLPWLTFSSKPDGRFLLVAPVGSATVQVTDLASQDVGSATVQVPSAETPVAADVAAQAIGPRIISLTPTNSATDVPLVSQVIVRFDKPLHPATVASGAVELRAANDAGVPVSMSLDLSGTLVSLYPVNPLAELTDYRVVVTTNVTDAAGRRVSAEVSSAFRTVAAGLARTGAGAELIAYEPTNGVARMEGTQGFADPGKPVILVNETTGRTSTVLAQPDGSFAGSIEMEEEDRLVAVVVNQNGTRNELRLSRQVFPDGSVALYEGGGTLSAPTEDGPLEVFIEPGSLTGRARIKLEGVSTNEFLNLISNTPPESATLVGALRVESSGAGSQSQAHLRFPVNEAKLGLPPGESPTNRVFVLTEPIEFEGERLYRVVDTMSWEDGYLVTHSPPFDGLMFFAGGAGPMLLGITMMNMAWTDRMTVVGIVVTAPASMAAIPSEEIPGALVAANPVIHPVPGAIVTVTPPSVGFSTRPGLRPGAFVGRTNSRGFYSAVVPFNIFEVGAVMATATHPRIPTLSGGRAASYREFERVVAADVVIALPASGGTTLDFEPPRISPASAVSAYPEQEWVTNSFLVRDDQSLPSLTSVGFVPEGSVRFQNGQPMPADRVSPPELLETEPVSPVAILQHVRLRVAEAGSVRFRLRAVDGSANESEVVLALRFGAVPDEPPGDIPPSDPEDSRGPFVVSAMPGDGSLVQPGTPIDLTFNEALQKNSTNGVSISGEAVVEVELSRDQRSLRLWPGRLQAASEYTLTLNTEVRDIRGNPLDQDPSTTAGEPFVYRLKTPRVGTSLLSGVGAPDGVVIHGDYVYTLDRQIIGVGYVRVHRLSPGYPLVNSIAVPSYPRAMQLIPSYSFKRSASAPAETKPLLIVGGGVAGDQNSPKWLRVYDLSRPEDPLYYLAPRPPAANVPLNTNGWVASALVSLDPTALISQLRFSAPRLAAHVTTPEGSLVYLINLQALILASNLNPTNWPVLPDPAKMVAGRDNNNDGDYADPEDILPLPNKVGIFGIETVAGPTVGRFLNDFDMAFGGATMLGAIAYQGTNIYTGRQKQPARLQVFFADGQYVGDGEDAVGGLEFPGLPPPPDAPQNMPTNYAFRVMYDFDFPVPDTNGVRFVPVALVSGEDLLRVVDLTVPEVPRLITQFRLGTNSGTIFSIQRTGPDEYTVATRNRTWSLRRSLLAERGAGAMIEGVDLPFEGRTMGVSSFYYAATRGNRIEVRTRAPRISLLQHLQFPPTNILALINPGPVPPEFLEGLIEPPMPVPVVLRAQGFNCVPGLVPPNPVAHYYAVVEMPGAVGSTIKVAVESLDARGSLLPPRGAQWPATILTARTADLLRTGLQPSVQPLVARRLSDVPSDPFYNLYVSDPLVLVREPLSAQQLTDLGALPGRQAIWSGHYLRLSLDADPAATFHLTNFVSRIQTPEFRTGLSKTYRTFPGEFVDNPNPSLRASPVVAGVNLQSGEFRTSATDLHVEGRHQPLVFTRSYESRSSYYGVLGRGWDFNWNVRIQEMPADLPVDICLTDFGEVTLNVKAVPGDVVVYDGNGGAMRFRKISASNGNQNVLAAYQADPAIAAFGWTNRIATYFESPPGEFSVLYRFKDGSWVMVAPNGARTHFHSDGRLDRVVGVYEASVLTCRYREDGKLDGVLGDRAIELRFGYYQRPGAIDTRPYDRVASQLIEVGLMARVQVKGPGGILDEASFAYDTAGNLRKKSDASGALAAETLYGYDSAPPFALTSIGRGDGTQMPSQRIFYNNGLVTKLVQDGEETVFGGAKATAAERYAAGASEVTVKMGSSDTARYQIDGRGRPTSFANRQFQANDAGLLTQVGDAETRARLVYDTNHPAYRFRGNLLRTEQAGRTSFVSTNGYDGSAWNRVSARRAVDGVVTHYNYVMTDNYLQRVEEVTGPVTRRSVFNAHGQLLKEEVEEAGHKLVKNLVYSPATQLPAGSVQGSSAEVTFGQNLLGGVDALVAGALSYTAGYNADFQLSSLSPATNGQPELTLTHTNGLVASERMFAANLEQEQTYQYDPAVRTRVLETTSRETGLPDATTRFYYDAAGRLTNQVTAGESTSFTYEGAQVTVMRGPGVSREMVLAGGRVQSLTDQGVTSEFYYDSQGRLERRVQEGTTNLFTYNLGEQLASKRILQDLEVLLDETYTYDTAGRLASVTSSGESKSFAYFGDGQLRRLQVGGVTTREVQRDDAGRLLVTGIPGVAEVHYDPNSEDAQTGQFQDEQLRLFTSGGGGAYEPFEVERTFDAMGRATRETRPAGQWHFEYDAFGHLVRRKDPDNVVFEQTFSPGGLLLSTRFTDGTTVSNVYNAARRLERLGGWSHVYDTAEGLPQQTIWPDGTLSQYLDYNEFFLPEVVNHGGIHQDLTYEEGRLVRVLSGLDKLEYDYDGLGRRTMIEFNDVKVSFRYTPLGQLWSEQFVLPVPNTPIRTWTASFTNGNRFAQEIYPSLLQLEWKPTEHGLPTEAWQAGIEKIEWLGADLLRSVQFTNGLRMVWDYDASLRLYSVRYLSGPQAAPTTNAAFLYQLTPGGRVIAETRVHEGMRTDVFRRNSNLEGMRVTDVWFSATNPVTGAGALSRVEGYAYDPNGELFAPTNAVGTDDRALHPSWFLLDGRLDTAAGQAVGYNSRGMVETVPVWVRLPGQTNLSQELATLTYDNLGMLQKVERTDSAEVVTVEYLRDGLGRIVQRTVDGPASRCQPGIRQYVWRGNQLIEEYDEDGGAFLLVRRYVYVGSDLVRVESATGPGAPLVAFTPLVTLTGSVGGYLAGDGLLAEFILYGSYGTPVFKRPDGMGGFVDVAGSAVAATLLFQGQWYDEETGLYQLGERNLHPQLGCFLQRDSQLYTTSRALYAAFNGDPAGQVDPSGAGAESPGPIQKAKEIKEGLKDLHKNAEGMRVALKGTVYWEGYKQTGTAKAGLDLVASALKFGGVVGGDNFKTFAKETTASFKQLHTGLDLVQEALDWRANRKILALVEVNTMPGLNRTVTGRMRTLTEKGVLGDWDGTLRTALESEAVKSTEDRKRGDGPAMYAVRKKAQSDYLLQRQGHLLSIGKHGHTLAKAWMDYAFKDSKAAEVQTARTLLEGSKLLLDGAEKFHKVMKNKDLAQMSFGIGKGAAAGQLKSLWGAKGNVTAAFEFGFEVGQFGVMQLADPDVAAAYKACVNEFKDNGGWTSVFGGVLATAGWDWGAYQVQKYVDFSLEYELNKVAARMSNTDDRWEFYRRGLEAP